jgi:hypothetical protein
LYNACGQGSRKRERVAEYHYTDETGTALYRIVRCFPKSFFYEARTAEGKWSPGLNKNVRRVLYRLCEVVAASQNRQPVFLVEGERDADNLHSLGLTATTCASGADGWRDEYTQSLIGASEVIILPDNDKPGREYANKVATCCHRDGVPCRIVYLPDLPEGGDVSDWLQAGGSRESLLYLVEQTPMDKRRGRPSKLPEVCLWLRRTLMCGPVPLRVIEEQAEEYGYGRDVLYKARKVMTVKTKIVEGVTCLFLPDRDFLKIQDTSEVPTQPHCTDKSDTTAFHPSQPHCTGNSEGVQSHFPGNVPYVVRYRGEDCTKLEEEEQEPENPEDEELDGESVRLVKAEHLGGEVVCFASDGARVELDERGRYRGAVVYRQRELVRLAAKKPAPDMLATIHAVKAEFGGEYLGTEG